MRLRIALFAVSLALFALTIYESWYGAGALNFWTFVFVLSVVAGLTFEYRLKRTYNCPRCRVLLPAPKIMPIAGNDEYVYACVACDTLWRTRTFPPDSAG